MQREKVILVQQDNLECLPPLITVVSALQKKYDVIVLTGRRNPEAIEKMWDSSRVEFRYLREKSSVLHKNFLKRGWSIRKRLLQEALWMRGEVRKILSQEKISFVWVGSAETAFYFLGFFKPKTYVVCAYELIDEWPLWRLALRRFYQEAKTVVVPERNRAYIFKFWMRLDAMPIVIPNKPEFDFRTIESPPSSHKKKVILYQGIFSRQERKLDSFCKAISMLYPDYEFLLVGRENEYSRMLCSKYKGVRYGGYFPPPMHLEITKNAYIGVATYASKTLNAIYCAPNKIWEYGGCGVPMLINDVPGLTDSLLKWGCAVVVDESSAESICSAIQTISKNHSFYSKNARKFYKSENIDLKIFSIEVSGCPKVANKIYDLTRSLMGVFARSFFVYFRSI